MILPCLYPFSKNLYASRQITSSRWSWSNLKRTVLLWSQIICGQTISNDMRSNDMRSNHKTEKRENSKKFFYLNRRKNKLNFLFWHKKFKFKITHTRDLKSNPIKDWGCYQLSRSNTISLTSGGRVCKSENVSIVRTDMLSFSSSL